MKRIVCLLYLFAAGSLFCQYSNNENNRYLQAQSYEQAGYPDKARDIYEELYNKNPSNFQYFNSLNRIYISLKQYESSAKILEQKLVSNSQDINLYGLLGSTYYLMGNEAKAFSIWDNGLKNVVPNQLNYKVIANYAIDRRAFEKAIDYLKEGEKNSDNPFLFSFDLANLYSITMQYKEAAEVYISILLKNPEQYQTVQNGLFSFTNKQEALIASINVFENKRDKDNINISYILASLYVQNKSYDKAYDIISEIDSKLKSQGLELYKFGQDLYNQGQFELASKVFVSIIDKYSSSPVISSSKLSYAKSLEANLDSKNDQLVKWKPFSFNTTNDPKKINDIINDFNEIVKLFPNTEEANEALYRIGNLKYSMLSDFAGAKEIFTKLINVAPYSQFSIKSYEDLGDIYLQEGDLSKSREMFQNLIKSDRIADDEKNYARYKEAKISFYEGDFPTGKELLKNVIQTYKDNNSNNALELALLMNTIVNDSSNLVIFAKAELLSEQKKFSHAKDKYLQIAQNNQVFVLQSLAKLRVAEMDLAMDDYDSSLKMLIKIEDEKEKNIYSDKALYLQGNIFQYGKKDYAKAIQTYEKLLAEFPNSIYLDDARSSINKLKNKIS